jgi:O-antigen/teichoic acid export membrane protein
MNPRFFGAVAWRSFAMASAVVSGMASLKLYSRYLTPDLYGVVLVALQIMACLPLLDGGFRTAINRRILATADPPTRTEVIRFGQTLYTWLGFIVLGTAAAVMCGYAGLPKTQQAGLPFGLFLALGLTGSLSVMSAAQSGLLVGLQAQSSCFILMGVSSWVNLMALWPALHFGAGVWAFPMASLASFLVVYPLTLWLIRIREPRIRFFRFKTDEKFWASFHHLKADAWACFTSQMATLLLFSMDVVIVGLLCSAEEAARYGILARMLSIIRGFVQSSSEAAWPLIAQQGNTHSAFRDGLVRVNAWVYGGVFGGATATLLPFIAWYMGERWAPTGTVLLLVAARGLITGLASTVTYIQYGLGQFQIIARQLSRELIAALVLSLALGLAWGLAGVSAGFLLATAFGTLVPIIHTYAKGTSIPTGRFLWRMWWRAALAFLVSGAVAGFVLPAGVRGPAVVGAGLFGFVTALLVGLGISFFQTRGKVPADSRWPRLMACLKSL